MHWPSLVTATGAIFSLGLAAASARGEEPAARELPSVQEMIEARTDVWGDAAQSRPNGASYEFFKDLLPPLRWVNTDFRHYPIVLSAPRSPQKGRLIGNGSAVNALANKPPMWHEQGTPVAFYAGEDDEPFGADLDRLSVPSYLDGYLPVVQIRYQHGGVWYRQEAFAPVDPVSARHGALRLRFEVEGGAGRVSVKADAGSPLKESAAGRLIDADGRCVLHFDPTWRWDADAQKLAAVLPPGRSVDLTIYTKRPDSAAIPERDDFDDARQACIAAWEKLLSRSVDLETPEPLVNDAWRATLIGVYMTAVGDRLHYSAGNAYAKLYEGECGDILRAVMQYGNLDDAAAMLKPLLEFNRRDTRFHVAGHKLQLLAYFYWMTRDADAVRAYEPLWRPSVDLILGSRGDNGLLPKDNYAGDVKDQVYSLNSNAACWRGLRDMAAVLDDIGSKEDAARARRAAAEYRQAILDAVARSERRDADQPFIPIALLADEPAHDPLTATRQGSYYDLMAPYVIGSEIFGQGSEREDWMIGYLQNHGGIAMGMIRTTPHQGQFAGEPGVNPLYGLRYQLALLRRDDRERAIVGFYGHLAQGMTRGTFIGGEGSRFLHGDANGRSFYLPPNAASNAAWLTVLRYLLIQDCDLDEDARPDTLRLLYAAPRRWLLDGRTIRISQAPTLFGPVSLRCQSRLEAGQVDVHVEPPPRPVKKLLLRAPLPEGWRVASATIDGIDAPVLNGDTVDLSGRSQPLTVRFSVNRAAHRP